VPDQRPVAQGGLVDDLGALVHGLQRARHLVVDAAAASRDVHHRSSLRPQPLQVGPLVLVALARDQFGRFIGHRFAGAHVCVAQSLEVEHREVFAFEVGDQIGRREQDGAVALLHGRSGLAVAGGGPPAFERGVQADQAPGDFLFLRRATDRSAKLRARAAVDRKPESNVLHVDDQ
jgi:hypothetical protein